MYVLRTMYGKGFAFNNPHTAAQAWALLASALPVQQRFAGHDEWEEKEDSHLALAKGVIVRGEEGEK